MFLEKLDVEILKTAIRYDDLDSILDITSQASSQDLNQGFYDPDLEKEIGFISFAINVGSSLDTVLALINAKAGIHVMCQDKVGINVCPIYIAISLGLDDLVDPLIKNGADLNYRYNEIEHALLHAAAFEPKDKLISTTELLLKRGIDPNIMDKDNYTALHIAAIRGNIKVCETLLKYKADINALTDDRNTALHQAVIGGNLKVVEMLVEKGINIEALNGDHINALDIALDEENNEIVNYLKNHGLKPTLHRTRLGIPCPVCLKKDAVKPIMTDCGHAACTICLLYFESDKCLMCRKQIDYKSEIRIIPLDRKGWKKYCRFCKCSPPRDLAIDVKGMETGCESCLRENKFDPKRIYLHKE